MVCTVFSDRQQSLDRGRVNIVYGPYDLDMDLAGLTVEEIHLSLRDVLGVGRDAESFHNGLPVENVGMIVAGGRLEFVRACGRKGADRPDWESPNGRIQLYCGDALAVLKQIPDRSYHSCVTSPAYWLLRDYEVEGQLGLEPTPQGYVARLVRVFDEVRRTLRDDGTCWVVLGDTYFGSNKGSGNSPSKENFRFRHRLTEIGGTPKSLALIPSRFAIAMTDAGWILRNRIIWHKPNATPTSAKDRFTVDFEEMFFFTKSRRYYFEQQIVPYAESTRKCIRQVARGMLDRLAHKSRVQGANMRAVWTIPVARCRDAHFAVYPEELIETPILAGCPPGGTVLDPFSGAGTTGIVCERLERSFLGIELNPQYVEIAQKRIREARERRMAILETMASK